MLVFLLCKAQLVFAGPDNFNNIKKYAKCAALQNIVANILSETEQDFYRHEYHHAAQDSMIVAMEFVRISEYSKATLDELYGLYLDEYHKLLLPEQDSNNVAVFVENLRPQITQCKYLNELQADIIRKIKNRRVEDKLGVPALN